MRSDEIETAQTVAMMDKLAYEDAGHRLVIDATAQAVEESGLDVTTATATQIAAAIFWWLKSRITYQDTPGTSPLVDQTLIPPATLLSMPNPIGDCPQFSMLAAAMFRVCCMRSFFKTIAADPNHPDIYSHIYNMVEVGPGLLMAFDSSNGPTPGSEYATPGKTRVWPQLNPVNCDRPTAGYYSSVTKGNLGMIQQRPTPPMGRNMILRSRMGSHLFQPLRGTLGDDGEDGTSGIVDVATGPTFETAPDGSVVMTGPNPSASELAAAGYPLSTPVTTPTSGPTGTTLALALAQDATQIAAPIVRAATQRQPYYVTNPATGQSVLYNPNTGTVAGGVSAALSSISPSMLLILAAVGIVFVAGRK